MTRKGSLQYLLFVSSAQLKWTDLSTILLLISPHKIKTVSYVEALFDIKKYLAKATKRATDLKF